MKMRKKKHLTRQTGHLYSIIQISGKDISRVMAYLESTHEDFVRVTNDLRLKTGAGIAGVYAS